MFKKRKMNKILIFCFIVSFPVRLIATPQIDDTIKYNGIKYSLLTFPLELYFDKYPEKRPETRGMSTALWRNYVATFEILDNQLYLTNIEVEQYDSTNNEIHYRSVINEIFPNQGKIEFIWYTGLLEISYGNLVDYGPKCYGCSTYENYMVFEINRGELIKVRQFSYKQYDDFKENQYQEFKKTKEYDKLLIELRSHGIGVNIDRFIKNNIIEYTTKIMIEK
jgi:hypothetical protein